MLIYADHKKEYNTLEYLRKIRILLEKVVESNYSDHSVNTEMLIKFGEFESSVVDRFSPEEDFIDPVTIKLRQASLLTGHIFLHSHSQYYAMQLRNILQEISSFNLPASIIISRPEGYAYYGLYPEMYFEATQKLLVKGKLEKVFVIGIRSIGTSLSSVISACLEDNRCKVDSVTLRPRGDYFSRYVKLSDQLKLKLYSDNYTHYLIVDEGPGLSGTSFCSVAEYLSCTGVPDEKIIFFPSWEPDASSFVSELSRKRWIRHEKLSASFEETILESGRLKSSIPYSNLNDISAGKWRDLFYKSEISAPAVYQNFEQRKYILTQKPRTFFIKFAGLGHYGKNLFERAQKLSQEGFSPKVYDIIYGFLIFDLIKGHPLDVKDINYEVLDRFASYLGFIARNFPSEPSLSLHEIKEMIRINIYKGIGDVWKNRLSFVEEYSSRAYEKHSVAIDGRMLPHEWLRTENGLIKTDSVHHHSDHLLPGSIDIAWDIAGTIVEFRLNNEQKTYFLNKYILFSKDKDIIKRLNFYIIAYSAFRLGYSEFASERLGELPDGVKFRNLSNYYSSVLKNMLQS